jgi:hypothetical protein
LEEFQRGKIEGFSVAAAARCRDFLITHTVLGARLVSATLTTAEIRTPEEWRRIMKVFRMRLERSLISGVWRVELQKRRAPHAHVLLWVPSEREDWQEFLRMTWLECIGGRDLRGLKLGEREYAAKLQAGADPGWVAYMAAHASKHKQEQLGWLGKQWGIWGRDRFTQIEPVASAELSGRGLAMYERMLRRWMKAEMIRKLPADVRLWRNTFVQDHDKHHPRIVIERDGQVLRFRQWTTAAWRDPKSGYHAHEVYRQMFPDVRALPAAGSVVRAYPPEVPRRLLAWAVAETANPF